MKISPIFQYNWDTINVSIFSATVAHFIFFQPREYKQCFLLYFLCLLKILSHITATRCFLHYANVQFAAVWCKLPLLSLCWEWKRFILVRAHVTSWHSWLLSGIWIMEVNFTGSHPYMWYIFKIQCFSKHTAVDDLIKDLFFFFFDLKWSLKKTKHNTRHKTSISYLFLVISPLAGCSCTSVTFTFSCAIIIST